MFAEIVLSNSHQDKSTNQTVPGAAGLRSPCIDDVMDMGILE